MLVAPVMRIRRIYVLYIRQMIVQIKRITHNVKVKLHNKFTVKSR